ncbi:hypothetical protein U729_3144 (plasmid) [Clostridium baratii str. Sullivan]|uniref:Pesticidal crystal protein Cry22Aa Ig-like domain-containing protein n=1 Tax=Clostridium baratii str. Sullivan TaxID=1415775 RepID=A0A0A7G097_9CLOT|nr:immunoglobulin-like domain-containing protein [Clostridium baratii]AIY85273.1 hypothetical protein U729_3144 [Clostridium baratii str. Sullivan]
MSIRTVGLEDVYIPSNSNFNELEGVKFFKDNKEIISPKVEFINEIKEKNLITYTLDVDGSIYKFGRNVYVVDKAPLIKGVVDKNINLGDTFNLLDGITAVDGYGKDITKNIKVKGRVNNKKTGSNILIYSVEDEYGTITESTREVIVNEYKVNLSSIPQQFAPICVRCDDNGILQQTGDINGNNEPNQLTETFEVTEECNLIFLRYKDINIISVIKNNEVLNKQSYDLKDNALIFNPPIKDSTIIVTYKLKNSFSVNYGPGGDYIDLKLNCEIEPNLVEVNFECDEENNVRPIDHLSLNSIYNTNYDGFIYIDKNKYEEKYIKIHSSVKYLFSNIEDKTRMYVELLDFNKNPVYNKEVNITCDSGKIVKDFDKTDINGVIPFTYYAPTSNKTITIVAKCGKIKTSISLIIKERNL